MCTYFDIIADTAGYGGHADSPMSGLNRTDDNILLYNPQPNDVKASPKTL